MNKIVQINEREKVEADAMSAIQKSDFFVVVTAVDTIKVEGGGIVWASKGVSINGVPGDKQVQLRMLLSAADAVNSLPEVSA